MSLKLNGFHHIAIIVSDYEKSKKFYLDILGCTILAEVPNDKSPFPKLHLNLNGNYTFELFSFVDSPARLSFPEAAGLRHFGLEADDLDESMKWLKDQGVKTEPIARDPFSKKRYFFFYDPDMLPIELFEKTPSSS
jgi:glyoxylase I family protein